MQLKDLAKFEAEYDRSHEDSALQTRGQFIKKFALHSLNKLTLDEHVVVHHDPSFCNLVESGTKPLANVGAYGQSRPVCIYHDLRQLAGCHTRFDLRTALTPFAAAAPPSCRLRR
jgi:hypothetical protein